MISDEMFAKLKRSLVDHEAYRKFPYLDTVGKITIGIGYNLSDRGISDEWIDKQFIEDVNYFYAQLCTFDWYLELNIDRQIVLIDMAFMGWKKFLEFKQFIKYLENHDYILAAQEMMNSKWAEQVKGRARDLAEAMIYGVYKI